MEILITAFEAFLEDSINASQKVLEKIQDYDFGFNVHTRLLPVEFKASHIILKQALDDIRPQAVICLGQAKGRAAITIERIAINIDDSTYQDNAGFTPLDETIFEDGENAYFSSLPIKNYVETLRKKGIPASVSNTAGTYVCNHVFYSLMYYIDKFYKNTLGGFIHLPALPAQAKDKANIPTMALEMQFEALKECILMLKNVFNS
ncbi:MAG: pyroglutamyl-peptidase I [Eubacteriales bacterium]|nr:pyroglutamyl-peptidase I [Eubacteriales bacterium]